MGCQLSASYYLTVDPWITVTVSKLGIIRVFLADVDNYAQHV